MATAAPTQDMPPTGGYNPINFKRVPAQRLFRGWQILAGVAACQFTGLFFLYRKLRRHRYLDIEMRSGRLAVEPMLSAERDRLLLAQHKRNQAEETELMKNVKGWEVGKLWGELIYKTIDKDQWELQTLHEFMAHNDPWTYGERNHMRLWV